MKRGGRPCRIKGAGKESAAERRISTAAQVDALADALADAIGIRWRLMVYLGSYAPMRPEELAGLRRRDAGARLGVLPAFLEKEMKRHLAW